MPVVRRAVEDDLHAILAIERESPTAPQWSAGEWASMMARDAGAPLLREVLVAEDGNGVAGFAVYTLLRAVFPPEAELESLAIAAAARRRGFARLLLGAVCEAAAAAGAELLSLEVRRGNAGALALYGECGFNPVGIRRGYYAAPTEDAVFMQLALSQQGR